MKIILSICLFLASCNLTAYCQTDSSDVIKTNYDSLISVANNQYNQLWLGCGYSGSISDNIKVVEILLKDSKYGLIKNLLLSKSPSTQYISVIACDLLLDRKQILLLPNEIDRINKIKKSKEEIDYCSGCTLKMTFSVSDQINHDGIIYGILYDLFQTAFSVKQFSR